MSGWGQALTYLVVLVAVVATAYALWQSEWKRHG